MFQALGQFSVSSATKEKRGGADGGAGYSHPTDRELRTG